VQHQAQRRLQRKFLDRPDDVLLGLVIEVLVQKRRRIKGVEQRPQLAQADLDQVEPVLAPVALRQPLCRRPPQHGVSRRRGARPGNADG
jgi:hypothetical protein